MQKSEKLFSAPAEREVNGDTVWHLRRATNCSAMTVSARSSSLSFCEIPLTCPRDWRLRMRSKSTNPGWVTASISIEILRATQSSSCGDCVLATHRSGRSWRRTSRAEAASPKALACWTTEIYCSPREALRKPRKPLKSPRTQRLPAKPCPKKTSRHERPPFLLCPFLFGCVDRECHLTPKQLLHKACGTDTSLL